MAGFPVTEFGGDDSEFFEAPTEAAEETEQAEASTPEAEEAAESEAPAPETEQDEEVPSEDDEFFKPAEEVEGDEKPEKPKTVPLKRLQKVISQRSEERDGRLAAEARAAELEQWKTENAEFIDVARRKYASTDDPAGLLAFDIAFCEAVEKLSKTDPNIARFAQTVLNSIKGDKNVSEKTTTTTEQPQETASDRLALRLIEKEAKTTIADALEAVDPKFVTLVTKMILESGDAETLADLDTATVRKVAAKFFKENNFTPADVIKKVSAKDEKEGAKGGKKKPPTASGAGKGAAEIVTAKGKANDGKGPNGEEKPKSLAEYQSRRAQRFDAIFREQ